MYRSVDQRKVTEDGFIRVARPTAAEGVGRALQAVYRSGDDLPAGFRPLVERLNRVRY